MQDFVNIMDTEPCTTDEYLKIGHDYQFPILGGRISLFLWGDFHNTHDYTSPDEPSDERPTPYNQDAKSLFLQVLKLYANSISSIFQSVASTKNLVNGLIIEKRLTK